MTDTDLCAFAYRLKVAGIESVSVEGINDMKIIEALTFGAVAVLAGLLIATVLASTGVAAIDHCQGVNRVECGATWKSFEAGTRLVNEGHARWMTDARGYR